MTARIGVMRSFGKVLTVLAWLVLPAMVSPLPVHADSVLNFPRLSGDPDTLTGIAIANPGSADAQVSLTAYGADGTPLSGDGVINPAKVTVPAGQQVSKLTFELFGSSLKVASAAWIQATSTTDGLTGFFLFLNSSITLMDGADLPEASQKIIFNNVRIDSGYSTELDIVNPGSAAANLTLRLAGTFFPPAPQTLAIPAHGTAQIDAASFFSVSGVSPGAYVIVDSDSNVAGFELVRPSSGDVYGLNARQGGEQLGTLYFLQTSVLGNTQSFLSLVNYSGDPVVVTISLFKPDGTLYDSANLQNNPVTRALNPESSLREDIASVFGFHGSDTLEGWIQVKSTANAINGFVSYSDTAAGAEATVTSPPEGRTRAIFSQIATSSGFFTGLSLLNPSSLAANVRVLALQKDGTILGVFDTVLPPLQRFKRLLGTSDLIPQASGQSSGFIFVKSDIPIYMSALIGTNNAWVNIPAQPAPDSYNPDTSVSTLKMSPAIAIVPPGASQRFTVTGAPSSLTWKVNGVAGGTPDGGVISGVGVFTAPKSVPASQVVTITAETSSQAAGASADVLDKVPFLTGLSVVQSVTYLDALGKVYSAELTALGSAPSIKASAASSGNSSIFEDTSTGSKTLIAPFPGEVISKIIAFKADNGIQYILLAAQSSGRIVRLDPVSKHFDYLVSGLNQPASIVIDPTSGDLLVVEQDKISTVPKATLQSGISSPGAGSSGARHLEALSSYSVLVPQTGGAGIAVDRCTGYVYYSVADQGTVIQYHPSTGTSLMVASGLNNPGQLLGIYRTNVSCPDSFHLLITERGQGRVMLLVPQTGLLTLWVDAPGITDLAFVPGGNPNTPHEAILLGNYTLNLGGNVFLVPLTTLYDNKPANPPAADLVLPKTDLSVSQTHSPNPVAVYEHLSFMVTVANKGPAKATGVKLSDTISAGAAFESATGSQGDCGQVRGIVTCNLGAIDAGARATVTITVSPNFFTGGGPNTLRNTASASSIEIDTAPADNTSTEDAAVTAPSATKLAISGVPAVIVSGTPFPVTVTLTDLQGRVSANYTGAVRFSSTDSSAVLPGNYTFNASDAGSHNFTVTLRGSGTFNLSIQDLTNQNLRATVTTSVLPASLAMSSATPSLAPNIPFTVTVSARDALGNPAPSYTGTVAFTSSDLTATLPANYTFTASDSGSHTFSGAFNFARTGSQTIRVADALVPAIAGTMTFNVGVSAAVTLQVTASPTSVVAGNGTTITVTARDDSGRVASGYTGTVRFSTADTSANVGGEGPVLNGFTYQFQASDNGSHSFSIFFFKAGISSISVTDTASPSIAGSVGVSVTAATPVQLVIAAPASAPAGTQFAVTANVLDAYGNNATGYTGTVNLSIASPVEGESAVLTSAAPGIYTFQVTLYLAGTRNLLAALTGTPALSTGTNITVTPQATAALAISGLPGTAGVNLPYNFRVTAFDTYGNITPAYVGTVHFTSTDSSATLPTDYQFTAADAGAHDFTVTFRTPSCQVFGGITAQDAKNSLSAPQAVLIAGPAYTFGVQLTPTAPIAGVFADITVTALDICNNTAVGFTGSISFSTTDPNALPNNDSSYTFTLADAGVHNFIGTDGVAFHIAGRQVVTVTGAVNPGQAIVVVSPGPAASLQVTSNLTFPGTPTTPIGITVIAMDQFGNVATGYRGTVHFTSSDSTATMPADYTFVASDAGVHVFTLTLPCNPLIGTTITATDTVTATVSGTTSTIFPCGG